MKSVCAKHEQAYEDSCPWCEKKAEGPTAAPAAPPVASPIKSFTMNANATAAAATPFVFGMCACGHYMMAGPAYRWVDGRGYLHTAMACQVPP